MTNAFAKSRYVAWIGGSAAGITAAAAAWLYMAQRPAGGFNRLLVAGLAAFVAVNLVLYAARIVAEKEYQKRLLLLYEKLDPQAFLEAVLPLKGMRLNASGRCTLLVHIANGYLYSGEPLRALEILDGIQPPDTALEMRGLVAGNRATCLLAAGETDRAQAAVDELLRFAGAPKCRKEFAAKARHTAGYLQICIGIARGKHADLEALQKDFEHSRSPLHKLDVQYRLALSYRHRGDGERMRQACDYLRQNGGGTCYPKLAERL